MMLKLFGRALIHSVPVVLALSVTGPSMAAADCGAEIDQIQAELDAALARRAATGPSAKESSFATTRRQPTPETVARAEAELGDWPDATQAVTALQDARGAEARGDERGCLRALGLARDFIRQ